MEGKSSGLEMILTPNFSVLFSIPLPPFLSSWSPALSSWAPVLSIPWPPALLSRVCRSSRRQEEIEARRTALLLLEGMFCSVLET